MTTASKAHTRLISKGEVLGRTGLSYPTIWQWMQNGKFPRSRDVGVSCRNPGKRT